MDPRRRRGRSGHAGQIPTRRALRVEVLAGDRLASAGLSAWLARIAPPGARGEVSVAVVSDARVRSLNRRYRGEDRATDVLSFPGSAAGDAVQPRSGRLRFLGDIVIARGVAGRQARLARHSPRAEIRVLALHGLLHLLGYDHERDTGTMARLERRLRAKGGLHASLIERA